MKRIALPLVLTMALAAGALSGCGGSGTTAQTVTSSTSSTPVASQTQTTTSASTTAAAASTVKTAVNSTTGTILDTSDMFSDRDLTQTADTSSAKQITVTSNQNVTISEEGVYVISGTAQNATIVVQADDAAKVQLVLDGVSITNASEPAIYVASADKVFITTTSGSTNTLKVTGTFASTLDEDADGAIFARDDITLNGLGTLVIESSDHAIVGKDDVKVTGGTYQITAAGHGIQANDSVRIADGTFNMTTGTDGIHAENADDPSLGYIYIADGTFNIKASSDGMEGDAVVQIDGGTFTISGEECIEGTYVQINSGTLDLTASDDGINATSKSTAYSVVIEINDGDIAISMAQGDTDAIDSNGDLIINGGTIDITAQSPFDYDGRGQLNGGKVTVNGQQVTQLTQQMMGGGAMGGQQPGAPQGMQGQRGGMR